MSRTRHHTKMNEPIRLKRKKILSYKQRFQRERQESEWSYMDLPIVSSLHFAKR